MRMKRLPRAESAMERWKFFTWLIDKDADERKGAKDFRKGCTALFLFLFLFTAAISLNGAPIVINDSRMEHLNGFPSIGRGYSLRSNRLQSMCLKAVKKTRPSFDLKYDIEIVSTSYLKNITTSASERIKNSRMNAFIQKYYKNKEQEGKTVYNLQNLIVKVEVQSYYYALDETKSPLSNSARHLLENKQYVTFFNSCGHHYVRSVGTFATYYALLQYRLKGDTVVDEDFKNKLEKGLFNFHGGEGTPKKQQNLKEDAEYRGLRVFVQGIGLSKGNMVNLIPVDINQFRRTVQDAVKLMQDPDSGLITRMEVVPWVENPELTAFMVKKDENTEKNDGGQQFIRMLRLEANSGVITEINRVSNHQVEQFHIATMCQNMLMRNYIDKSNEALFKSFMGKVEEKTTVFTLADLIQQKVLSFDPLETKFYNHIAENEKSAYISLLEFIKYFALKPPKRFFDVNRKYLYGDGKKPGALHCIDQLYKIGLDKADYRTVPSCVEALKPINLDVSFLEQYCLPKPVSLVFKGTKKEDGGIRDDEVNKDAKTDTEKIDIKKDIENLQDMRPGEDKGKKVPDEKKPSDEKPVKKETPADLFDLRPEEKKPEVKNEKTTGTDKKTEKEKAPVDLPDLKPVEKKKEIKKPELKEEKSEVIKKKPVKARKVPEKEVKKKKVIKKKPKKKKPEKKKKFEKKTKVNVA